MRDSYATAMLMAGMEEPLQWAPPEGKLERKLTARRERGDSHANLDTRFRGCLTRGRAMSLDLAKRYGFMPRLCQPYRARTKGKIERFHRYLRGNFYVRLSSWLKQSGMLLDVETANAEVGKWLRDVANQRGHPVTGAPPARLFEEGERHTLRTLPEFATPRPGATPAARPTTPSSLPLQHPLSVYQQLLTQVRA
jgi:transposase InsO family protein